MSEILEVIPVATDLGFFDNDEFALVVYTDIGTVQVLVCCLFNLENVVRVAYKTDKTPILANFQCFQKVLSHSW